MQQFIYMMIYERRLTTDRLSRELGLSIVGLKVKSLILSKAWDLPILNKQQRTS